jgi:hypothetical protein
MKGGAILKRRQNVLIMPDFSWKDWEKQGGPVRISGFQIRIRNKPEAEAQLPN